MPENFLSEQYCGKPRKQFDESGSLQPGAAADYSRFSQSADKRTSAAPYCFTVSVLASHPK